MARRRLSKRRLALFAAGLLCAAFGARWVAIQFSSPTSVASGDPAPSRGSAGAAHGLGAHARLDALLHGSHGRDERRADATRATREESHVVAEKTRSDATASSRDDAFAQNKAVSSVSSSAAIPSAQTVPPTRLAVSALPEVDSSTHVADAEAALKIANAGTRVAGTADALSTDRPVLATFVSNGFHEFMLNWYGHVVGTLQMDNVIVAALDEQTEQLCASRGIPFHSDADLRYTFDVMATGGQPLHDQNAKVTMQGKAFQQIGALKAAFLLYLLERGHEVLVSDVDTVWLRDPRSFFKTERVATEADLAVSTDCLSHTHERESNGCWHMQFNTGVLFLRPTRTTKRFVGEWRDALLETEHAFEHDQDIFNRLLRVERDGSKPQFRVPVSGSTGSVPNDDDGSEPAPTRVAARGVTVGALPLSLFCGGHTFFVQRLQETLGVQPLVVHTTYQFSQARGKRQRLREHGLWLLDDAAYYGGITNEAGEGDAELESGSPESAGPGARFTFVAMDVTDAPPKRLIASASVSNHLDAAAWYRLAVRNLLAVARATNRIAILPEITCACDRYWGNVLPECSIGGADVKPPYKSCPQDHVFNLPNMERAGVRWREHSFLENENVKKHNPAILTPSGRVYLELSLTDDSGDFGDDVKEGGGGFENGDEATKPNAATRLSSGRTVVSPAFPTDADLVRSVGDAEEGLLIVSSGITSFCGFEDSETARLFDEQMRVALEAESHFCGAGAGGVGRSCDIGFDIPRGVAEDRDCAAMRAAASRDPEAFRQRYERIGRHQDTR
jgi:hypothetical protein